MSDEGIVVGKDNRITVIGDVVDVKLFKTTVMRKRVILSIRIRRGGGGGGGGG